MLEDQMFFESNTDVRSIDIPTLFQLSDVQYREYVRQHLHFIDHHDVLRSEPAGYGLATTREQLDILISELAALRSEIPLRKDR